MTEYPSSGSIARSPFSERLAYPDSPLLRSLTRSPIFLWRMGFGPLLGRLFLILTHIGRHTGKIRRTALEFHSVDGRIYVFNGWPQSDWYHNILAEPRVTVQTARETFSATARPLVTQHDYLEAYELVERSPMVRAALSAVGVDTSLGGFLAARDELQIVTFDRSESPGPPPLKADLRWLSPVAVVVISAAVALGFIAGKKAGEKNRPIFAKRAGSWLRKGQRRKRLF